MKGASVIEVIPRYRMLGFVEYSNAPANAAYDGITAMLGIFSAFVILYRYTEVRAKQGRLSARPANPVAKSESIMTNGKSRKCGSGIHTVPIWPRPGFSPQSANFLAATECETASQ